MPPPPDEINKLNLNEPCRVVDVEFSGVKRTRRTLLAKIVSDLFTSKSLLDCLQKSIQIRENLRNLNSFSNVEMQIEPSDETSDNEFRVTFLVEERGRILASAQTSVDHETTHLNLELATPNLNGIGDSVRLLSKFNGRFYSGECRYTVPIAPWRLLWNPIYSVFLSQYQYGVQPSGHDQEDKSFVNQVEFSSAPHVKHTIGFENVWRYIRACSTATPIEIREQSGHSVKSALKHTIRWDNRSEGNFPYKGISAWLSNEFTTNLVNNGARFTRHEGGLQMNALLVPEYDLLCQLNILGGTLLKANRINLCDKFFAGGPLTLRGFKFQGLEPNIGSHPLGAMSFMSAGLHIYSILPHTTPETPINQYIRPHIFLNTGTIGDLTDLWRRSLSSRDDLKREAQRFWDSLRYSCGFGLVMHLIGVRLEVNYCLPLVFRENDLCSRGLQWGFGLTYT